MLKVSYISPVVVVAEKPKVKPRQSVRESALETLALRQHHDKIKAKELFSNELSELEIKENYYKELTKNHTHLF